MKVKEFEAFVASNAKMALDNLEYSVIGLCGEAGEVAEWYKKSHLRGNPKYTDAMLKSELGDVLHYVSRISQAHGWSLKDLMTDNVEKLIERNKDAKQFSGLS
jgi:NTP pyrophosphatase (non-canonical NTP hydrolase)